MYLNHTHYIQVNIFGLSFSKQLTQIDSVSAKNLEQNTMKNIIVGTHNILFTWWLNQLIGTGKKSQLEISV